MIQNLLGKIFGTRNERILKQCYKTVAAINALEPAMKTLSEAELKNKTSEFRERYNRGESLDKLLPEAFAVAREVSFRTLGLRHFDVQLIGGMVLHGGKIAEMRTGEGKTLVATLPAYLNAITGLGVHIVTVNDYLAKRDADWMRPVYEGLGLTVGVNLANMSHEEKKAAYQADITYGTNNEFGFDYLRDNMVFSAEFRVQKKLNYAIVDEVDSILIDEARTPLIISGAAEDSSDLYIQINRLIPQLKPASDEVGSDGDYTVDEKTRQAFLTEQGHQKAEDLLIQQGLLNQGESLYDLKNIALVHHLSAALRAHALYQRDVDYIVKDNEVIIVDEHTGRLMSGRRWSDGLHQATEAKENVPIKAENQTLATITLQNYFRLYQKLAGMTGTADTEAYEFQSIYGLEVVIIPTNKPIIRKDHGDKIYISTQSKYKAIVDDIKNRVNSGQPILVGTASIESSEYLSQELKKAKVPHQVLNAKFHEKEAKIVAQAGKTGAVTIATNMAGRGTDIVLGGNLKAELAELENPSDAEIEKLTKAWQENHDKVIAAGGLHVLGTERNEARRIDNQLRGRSGRQGDPGSSQYYLSMEDNLMRIFAPERMTMLMRKLGLKEDEVIENALVNRAIENAQRKVEGHNFDIRKQLLEYDDVANDQRKVIYQQRAELMEAEDLSDIINNMRHQVINKFIDLYIPPQSIEDEWNIKGLEKALADELRIDLPLSKWLEEDTDLHEETLREKIDQAVLTQLQSKEAQIGAENMRRLERNILLQVLDQQWKEHLSQMDYLRKGIHLRGYAQKNPKQEYKREAFEMFTRMLDEMKFDVIKILTSIQIQTPESVAAAEQQQQAQALPSNVSYIHQSFSLTQPESPAESADAEKSAPFTREAPKVGRNDPCPCGSGKKYKHCHGVL